jgi:hypothetical protein
MEPGGPLSYRAQKIELNRVHNHATCFSKENDDIIPPSLSSSPSGPFPSDCPTKICYSSLKSKSSQLFVVTLRKPIFPT